GGLVSARWGFCKSPWARAQERPLSAARREPLAGTSERVWRMARDFRLKPYWRAKTSSAGARRAGLERDLPLLDWRELGANRDKYLSSFSAASSSFPGIR